MATNYHDNVIALAALMQHATLVQDFANRGDIHDTQINTAISSIVSTKPTSVESVYGNYKQALAIGFRELQKIIGEKNQLISKQAFSYMLDMLAVERSLHRNKSMQQKLRRELDTLQQQANFIEQDTQAITNKLAEAYTHTISHLSPRIHIAGTPEVLENDDKVALLRTLLLAGIRAARLWRQSGGRRWQLFFSRKKMNSAITQVMKG